MQSNPFETPRNSQLKLPHKRTLQLSGSAGAFCLTNNSIRTQSPRRSTRFELDPNTEDTRIRTERAVLESVYLRQLLVKQQIETGVRAHRVQGKNLIQRLYNCCQRLRSDLDQHEELIGQQKQWLLLTSKLNDLKAYLDEQGHEWMEKSWHKLEPNVRQRLDKLTVECCDNIRQLPGQ